MSTPGGTYGSSLVIEEVTGTRLWSVTLTGSGLPHQGAGWGVENRVPTEFYPGNFTEGTQQVIGPKEAPSHFTGIWRRTMLLRSPAVITPGGQETQTATPGTLADFIEQLIIGGARLRVTWTQTKTELIPGATPGSTYTPSGPQQYQKIREGRATKFEVTPLTGDDIKWDISWSWVGRANGVQQTAVSTRDGDTSASTAAVQSAITDALNNTGTSSPQAASDPLYPLSATPDTLGLYESFSPAFLSLSLGLNTSLLAIQLNLTGTTTVANSIDSQPSQINNSVLNLSVDTVATVNGFTDALGRIPFEVLTVSDQETDVAYAAASAATQAQNAWIIREAALATAQRARLLASTNPGGGQKGVQQTSSTGAGQILGVCRTRDGDTPQSIARQWYGDADRALDLCQANHIPLGQPSFPTGTVLMIPVLRSSQAQG